MCSAALHAIEARQMAMSLLGLLILQSQAGSWSTDFNIKILVHIPVVACTAYLIVLGCRFKSLADWRILNSLILLLWYLRHGDSHALLPHALTENEGKAFILFWGHAQIWWVSAFHHKAMLAWLLVALAFPLRSFCWSVLFRAPWRSSVLLACLFLGWGLTPWDLRVSSLRITIPHRFCPLLIKEATPSVRCSLGGCVFLPWGRAISRSCVRRCDVRAGTETGKPR